MVVVIRFTQEEFVLATAKRVTEQGDRMEIHITVRTGRLTGAGKKINRVSGNCSYMSKTSQLQLTY